MNAGQRKRDRKAKQLIAAGKAAWGIESAHAEEIARLKAEHEAELADMREQRADIQAAALRGYADSDAEIASRDTRIAMLTATERELRAMLAQHQADEAETALAAQRRIAELEADDRDVTKLRRRLQLRDAELAEAHRMIHALLGRIKRAQAAETHFVGAPPDPAAPIDMPALSAAEPVPEVAP